MTCPCRMQDSVVFHIFTAVCIRLLLITALPHPTPTHIPLLGLGSGKLPSHLCGLPTLDIPQKQNLIVCGPWAGFLISHASVQVHTQCSMCQYCIRFRRQIPAYFMAIWLCHILSVCSLTGDTPGLFPFGRW